MEAEDGEHRGQVATPEIGRLGLDTSVVPGVGAGCDRLRSSAPCDRWDGGARRRRHVQQREGLAQQRHGGGGGVGMAKQRRNGRPKRIGDLPGCPPIGTGGAARQDTAGVASAASAASAASVPSGRALARRRGVVGSAASRGVGGGSLGRDWREALRGVGSGLEVGKQSIEKLGGRLEGRTREFAQLGQLGGAQQREKGEGHLGSAENGGGGQVVRERAAELRARL